VAIAVLHPAPLDIDDGADWQLLGAFPNPAAPADVFLKSKSDGQ
jgi:hypothetical protein